MIIMIIGIIAFLIAFILVCAIIKKIKGGEDVADKYNQDGSVSQQWLAEEITSAEGGVKEVDIGQTKQILKITLDLLAGLEPEELKTVLEKHD